jgi:hypothetical protein
MSSKHALYTFFALVLIVAAVVPLGGRSFAQDGEYGPVVKCDNQNTCSGAVRYLKLNGYDLRAKESIDPAALSDFARILSGDRARANRYLAANIAANALTEAGMDQATWQGFFGAIQDSAALQTLVMASGVANPQSLLTDLKLAAALGFDSRGLSDLARVSAVKDELRNAGVSGRDLARLLAAQWNRPNRFEPMLAQRGIDPVSFWSRVEGLVLVYYGSWGFEGEITDYVSEYGEYYGDYYDYYGDYYDYYGEYYGDYYDYYGEYYGDYYDYYGDYYGDYYDYYGEYYGDYYDYWGDYYGDYYDYYGDYYDYWGDYYGDYYDYYDEYYDYYDYYGDYAEYYG